MLVTKHLSLPEIDALLVLGRGIDTDGNLSGTSAERADWAMHIASVVEPSTVVFSGGRSWQQVNRGELPPSEGGAMLRHARATWLGALPVSHMFAEEESTSTVGNMVLSAPLLNLRPGDRLGLLTDKLHTSLRRTHFIATKVFPGIAIVDFEIANYSVPTQKDVAQEVATTALTHAALLGVKRGNLDAIGRRQAWLDRLAS